MYSKLHNYSIFLIGGKAGSGKDTIALHLVNNYSFIKFAFADVLKEYVSNKYKINIRLMNTQIGKKTIIYINNQKTTIRDLLIKEAMEHRDIDENYWINIVLKKLSKLDNNTHHKIVISDFRFPNEYYELCKVYEHVTAINVERNECENINNISETSLNNFLFDHTIKNNKSKDDLLSTIDGYIKLM